MRADMTPDTVPNYAPTPARASDGPFGHLPPYQPPSHGILSHAPARWVPYLELSRIDKPGGLYAFYIPYVVGMGWASSIASPTPTIQEIAFVAGTLLVWTVWHRGAACTVNDILDREFDRKVERCRLRPVARRAVTVPQAWGWYWTQCAGAAATLALLPHPFACFYHAVPIVFLLSVYPLFKRWTDYPQVVLGVPLSWAVLLSCSALGVDPWTAQSARMAAATACLFASEMARLIQLDYVYGCQDSRDDIKAGVRSMAVRFWDTGKFIVTMGSLHVALLAAAGVLAGLSPVYFTIACGGNVVMFTWMAKTVDRNKPKLCAWWFLRGGLLIGGMTALALLLDCVGRRFTRKSQPVVEQLAAQSNKMSA